MEIDPHEDWTDGLPECPQFLDSELPLNKDKRYAMSVDPASLRDAFGNEIPLRACVNGGDIQFAPPPSTSPEAPPSRADSGTHAGEHE